MVLGPVSPNPWLYIPKSVPHRTLRLFCLPHAAGGASYFRPWAAVLPPEIEVCGVQLPGHETRFKEPLETDLARLVSQLASGIEALLSEPFALFGHSMGALLAFELARELRRRGIRPPVHLFLSGRKAPHSGAHDQFIWSLAEPEFLRAVTTRYNGIPKAVLDDPELMRIFLPILRADIKIIETHVCRDEEPLGIPVSVFSGLDDRSVTFTELAAWRPFTKAAFRLEMLPGGHFYLQQNLDALAASLQRDLSPFAHSYFS